MSLFLRQEKIKQREGDRLKRSLRSLFGGKDFGFLWVDDETSYTDGKTIFIKYDVQTPQHRPFTPEECRILRKSHGIHERGHIEFDYLQDYFDWQEEMGSNSIEDWKDFTIDKYPAKWNQFFGNMSLDGRMENLVVLKFPSYKDYVDFCNYEWRFGIREKGIGKNPIIDFQSCYATRVLGMVDLDGWMPESVELVNSVQKKIDKLRTATSTKECLSIVTTIMREVWPTLAEWMDLNNMEMDNPPENFHSDSHEDGQQWGDEKDTAENAEKVLVKVKIVTEENEPSEGDEEQSQGSKASSEDDDSKDSDEDDDSKDSDENDDSGSSAEDKNETSESKDIPDFSHILVIEKKQLNKDKKEVEEEVQDFEVHTESVEIEIPEKKKRLNENIQIRPYKRQDLDYYHRSLLNIKRFIKPTAKAFKELLEGEKDEVRRNIRSGRFMPNKAWRAVHCEDNNVFQKQRKGTPKGNAYVSLMADISWSTSSSLPNGIPVFQELKKAMQLLLEALWEAKVPSTAYAFTEYSDSVIFPIKPNPNRFGAEEKGYLGGIFPEGGNRDTLALKWMIDQVQKRSEEIRLAIMLSDGLPVFEPDEGPETIRLMVESAEKQGIDVLCLFIGQPNNQVMDLVKQMYPGRAIFANQNIARELQKHVKRMIRQRRK